jgi:hypothetical protein
VYIYDLRGEYGMLRFSSRISHPGNFIVAILLWLPWAAGAGADQPRAFHLEGGVVGAHDPSITKEGDLAFPAKLLAGKVYWREFRLPQKNRDSRRRPT